MRFEVGPSIEVSTKYHNQNLPKQVKGEHLWIVVSMYSVTPGKGRFDLDQESLMNIEGPGCYWCEKPWTEELGKRRCNA